MTDEQLSKLKKQVCEALACDRHQLLIKFPFVGNILMRMELVPIRDKRVRTACTDGKKVYFDIDFYTRLRDEERVFVLAHEVWHCVLLHLVRCQTRNVELFNIASDMEVNYMLSNQPQKVRITPPAGVLMPPSSMTGKSAEVIYEWLAKKQKKGQNSFSFPCGAPGGSGGSGYDDDEDYESQSDDSCDSSGNSGKNHGNKTGKLEGQFDSHKYSDGTPKSGNGGGGDGTIKDQWGEVGFDKDFQPKVSDQFAEEMREAVITEVQRAERTQGTIPIGLDEVLKEITKPEIKWQEVLAQFVTSCYNGKRRWLPPSRRHVYDGIYLQSRRNERINIAVAIDTSGSCVGDLPKFFGELKHLVETFGSYSIALIQCDAAVDNFEQYNDGHPLDIDAAKGIEWSGGGGTSFCPVFKFIREKGLAVDCLVYFTDSFGNAPQNPPPYPVLWILTKDGNEDFCDWGRKVKFKNSSYDDPLAE